VETIELESVPGRGSTFTLFLPVENVATIITREASDSLNAYQQQLQLGGDNTEIDTLLNSLRVTNEPAEGGNMNIVSEMINDTGDDRTAIQQGDKIVLIVEDDLRFGRIIIEKAQSVRP